MSLIEWNMSLSVNNKEIDQQHQHLIHLLNQTHEAMKKGESARVLSKILQELLDYTITHFSAEEKLMKSVNYPNISSHQQEHKFFTDKVKNFYEDYQKGKVALSSKVLLFLSDWVRNHIEKTDKLYSSYLK